MGISIINNGEVLQDSQPRQNKCLPMEPASARRFIRFTGQTLLFTNLKVFYCMAYFLHLCHISHTRYNNTLADFSSIIFYTDKLPLLRLFLIMTSFDFQCLPYASLKIMRDCADIDN